MSKIKKRLRGRPKGSTSDNPASETFKVRVTPKQLENYKRKAKIAKMKFSEWVRAVLDKALHIDS